MGTNSVLSYVWGSRQSNHSHETVSWRGTCYPATPGKQLLYGVWSAASQV